MGTAPMILVFAFAMVVDGTVIWNRATGPLPAFTANEPRDTEKITDPGAATPVNLETTGFDVEVVSDVYTVGGSKANAFRCFQNGYCEAGETLPSTTAITLPVNPADTGMSVVATDITFSVYNIPADDSTYTYKMAFRNSNATHGLDDLQRLAAEIYQVNDADPNDADLTNWNAAIVTWEIFVTADTSKLNYFQLAVVHDGTDTFVIYFYGPMTAAVTGMVMGYISGGSADKSARICNVYDAAAPTDVDKVLPDDKLSLNSNYRCGNPGVYVFKTAAGELCAGSNTDCATSYALADSNKKPNCNASAIPTDTCRESSFCQYEPSDLNLVNVSLSVKHYAFTNPYIWPLNYDAFVDTANGGTDDIPKGIQTFVPDTAAPSIGPCGKVLSVSPRQDTLDIQIKLDETEVNNLCGMTLVTGPPLQIKFAFKIFEWDETGTSFGQNEIYDSPGDLLIQGACNPDDLHPTISADKAFNEPRAPTSQPPRTRKLVMQAVDFIDDDGAHELTSVDIGRQFHYRICFNRGTDFNPNADPFGIFAFSCYASNMADFTPTDATREFSNEFIGDDSCPIDPAPGPFFYNSDFKVQSGYTYGSPPEKWCIYTSKISARKWNTFDASAVPLNNVYTKCIVNFCYILDGASGTYEPVCFDNCASAKRRKRSASNETSRFPDEVVYSSIRINDPESKSDALRACSNESTDFKIALATIGTLLALLVVSVLAAIFVFVRVMRLNKLDEKMRPYK